MKRVQLFGMFNKLYEAEIFEAEDPTIKAIQAALKSKGPEYASLLGTSGPNGDGVDGQSGPKTIAAIKKFQQANGISPTGFVGKQTAPKLGVQPMTSVPKPAAVVKPVAKPVAQPVPHKGVSKNVPEMEPDTRPTGTLDLTPKSQTATVDTFSPYAKNSAADSIKYKYENFLKGTIDTLKNTGGIPMHIRVFINYLVGRTAPYTAAGFTKEEIATILAMIRLVKKKGGTAPVDFYDASAKLNTGGETWKWGEKNFGLNQLNLKELPTKVAMTLGNTTVVETPTSYQIKDIYDFNNYQNNPEKYTLAEVPNTIGSAVKLMAGGNYVQGVEQIASYKQKLGYKGFPIDIVIPKNFKA
jgi:peptidoglycan hydrolase-like protein with peptidoglycan-binding domain